ncbi:chorismate-binding protein, partial [Bacillus thuringiensis serovar darmstadiensis]
IVNHLQYVFDSSLTDIPLSCRHYLENEKRNVYAGAVGYVSFSGNLDMALAIRTMVVKDEKAYVQAGAGVVYDSDPVAEYEETLNKARALLEVMK